MADKSSKLRFAEFTQVYSSVSVSDILEKYIHPVTLESGIEYNEIGIRSWGKGIFYKKPATLDDIGNKRIFWIDKDLFIINIVFAWEQAVARTSVNDIGKVASHRFPMFRPVQHKVDLDYLVYFFNTGRGKHLLELASPGGAGRNKTLGQKEFSKLKLTLPTLDEQQKIADFLSAVDEKIRLLKEKHALLQQYKKGVMQKLFSQEIRFKDDNNQAFPDWKLRQGNELFSSVSDKKHNSDLPILAITQEHGAIPRDLINYQVQATDSSVASYKVVNKGDFIISLRSFQGGIEYSRYKGICSPAYIILRPCSEIVDDFYRYYLKTGNFIQEMKRRLEGIRDGKILSYKYFSEIKLPYPCVAEQQKIADFLQELDKKLAAVQQQIELTQTFKKGLLQQMFV